MKLPLCSSQNYCCFIFQGHVYGTLLYKELCRTIFTIVLIGETFPMVSRATQTKIICKSYALEKLMYQLTTLLFTKLLVFHFLGSYIGCTMAKCMVQAILTIVILDKDFPTFFEATQIEIICKSYALGKLAYQYHLKLYKIVGVSNSSVIFRLHNRLSNGIGPFHYCASWLKLSNNLSNESSKDHIKSYTPRNLTYQLTTLRFTTILVFHLLGSCLGYNIDKAMWQSLLTNVLHNKKFPIVSQVTLMKII